MSQSNAYSDLRVFGEIKAGKLTVFGEYSLPIVDGLANQILVTDGAGNITFQDASAVALTPPSIVNGTGINWSTIAPNTIQGNITLVPFTTDNLTEGATNLYYQDEYVDDRVNALLINGTGITKVYNDSLNTLTIGVTLAPFTTTNLAEGVNLYYTDERVEDRMAAVLYKGGRGTGPDAISWTHVDGLDRIFPTVSLTPFSTDDLAEGATNLYLTENSLYDLMDQIIQDSASVTWTRDTITNQLTATAVGSTLAVQLDGSQIASNATVDFITTPSITYTINDDIINSKTTIQIDVVSDAVIVEDTGIGSAVRKDNLNNSLGDYSTVSGGSGNTASGDYSAIVGGTCNSATSVASFIGGGANHNVSGDGAPASASISPVSSGPFPGAVDGSYAPTTQATSGVGVGTKMTVQIVSNALVAYQTIAIGVNYQVGDTITIDGADIGGSTGVDDIVFTVDAVFDGGSTTTGGFNNDSFGIVNVIGGGANNSICAQSSTIGGGVDNCIGGFCSISDFGVSNSILGGTCNSVLGAHHAIVGGENNTISALYNSTIGGGVGNTITIPLIIGTPSGNSTIGGGDSNSILSGASTIGGGKDNTACGDFSTISGGYNSTASGCYSTVGGGRDNTVSNAYSTVSGGYNNTATGISSTVGGGRDNYTLSYSSTVSGGSCNIADDDYSTISGGFCNSACGIATTIGGGLLNTVSCNYSTISGGYGSTVSGCFSTIGGGSCNDVSNIGATIGGGACNTASGQAATVGGGVCNLSSCNVSTVSGGFCNTSSSYTTTVGGGNQNVASNNSSIVGGGFQNTASGYRSAISGGENNIASNYYSTVGGGRENTSSGNYSTVSGGYCNTASGACSTVSGGFCNTVTHDGASAVGCNITSVCPNTLHTNYLNLYDTPAADQCNTAFLVRGANGMVNYRPFGGLFAQTAQSSTITATVTESSLITTGAGSLTVPSNGFVVGDSFTARLAGTMSAANGQTLRVRVNSGLVVLADTGTMTLPTITSKYWQLEIGFTIRAIGAATVAVISSNGLFSYTQNSGTSHEGIGFDTVNSTTFDTTGSNTLSVTAQWGSTNATNSIFSSSFTLHKTF